VAQPQPGQLEAWLDHGVGVGGARSYLRKVQAQLHWLPREAVELAAEHYDVSFVSLYEDVSFSPYFSLEPRGERVIELCQGLACREAGSDALLRELEDLTGLKNGQTDAEGTLTLLGCACFGRCALGANARVQGRFQSGLGPGQGATLLQDPGTDG
jgi:NADH:ubiquinone oxidoreductase subunit E